MPVLSKKGFIKSLWVHLHGLALLGQGEPACFHWELCLLALGHSSRSNFHRRSPEHQELRDLNWSARPSPWQRLSFWSSLSTLGTSFAQIFRIFRSSWIIVCTVPTLTSNYALIVSIDTRRSLSMKIFICPINAGVLTSFLLPNLSSSLTDSLPSLNLLCYSNTEARFMQGAPKAVWCILYVSVAFVLSLKQNFIAYSLSKVSSCPDFIFEIHQ